MDPHSPLFAEELRHLAEFFVARFKQILWRDLLHVFQVACQRLGEQNGGSVPVGVGVCDGVGRGGSSESRLIVRGTAMTTPTMSTELKSTYGATTPMLNSCPAVGLTLLIRPIGTSGTRVGSSST